MLQNSEADYNELLKKDHEIIWHPFAPLLDKNPTLFIEKAEGVRLHLSDGKTLIDAVSSWWVNIHGHSNQELAEVLHKQALQTGHVIFAGFTHENAVKLVDQLKEVLAHNYQRAFFSDDGSTAVEVAIKLAIQYWANQGIKRKKIITFEGGYHGDTFGAMSLGGKSDFFSAFNDYLFEVIQLPLPQEGKEQEVITMMEGLNGGEIAAFIFEPLIQGSAGMRIYSAEVLEQLMKIAREKEIICIADEVMTGFGRTGKLFATDYINEKPDVICLSKGITGGLMSMGLTMVNQKLSEPFLTEDKSMAFYHGHSYTGNPLACAVAVKSLEILLREETTENINRISASHLRFKKELEHHQRIKSIKSLGTILSIEIDNNSATSYFNNLRDLLYQAFIEKGILLRPLGNIIYVLPPYVISDKDLKYIYTTIEEVIDSL